MSSVKAPLSLKLRVSSKSVLQVLRRPAYLTTALLVAFFTSGFIVWSLNIDLFSFIATNPVLSIGEKIRVYWDVHTGILSSYQSIEAMSNIIFSLLFGCNIALVIYVIRHYSVKNIPKKSGGLGLLLAITSGGCIACGTSILAPILISIGVTSTVAARELSSILSWLGSLAVCYSIYALGLLIANTTASNK